MSRPARSSGRSLGKVVAAGLGKIGHTDRGQILRCHTCKSSQVECQVRLIEESAFGCEGGDRAVGHVVHLAQRRLKPDDSCVALRAIANPDAHQPVQVTRAHVAMSGQVRNPQAPMLTLNSTKRRGYRAVEARMLEALQQKPLE